MLLLFYSVVRIKNKWTHLTIGAPIAIGGATGELLGRKVIGIGGPYIGAIIGNTVSGAVGGGVSGAISGGINAVFVNESDKEAFSEAVKGVLRGAANGALFGAISGAASGFIGGTDGGAVSRDAAIVAVTLTLGTFAQSQVSIHAYFITGTIMYITLYRSYHQTH